MAREKSEEGRKSGGGKLSRSETVTVRLDPQLRYLAELAARKQRRTLSSFIEWAIEGALHRVILREADPSYNEDEHFPEITVGGHGPFLWDVDEADRFVRLAQNFPELLTHEEQILWKLIRENGFLWTGNYDKQGQWSLSMLGTALLVDRLRANWDRFKAVAAGTQSREVLPTWKRDGVPSKDLNCIKCESE
jgi:hypothetical protein